MLLENVLAFEALLEWEIFFSYSCISSLLISRSNFISAVSLESIVTSGSVSSGLVSSGSVSSGLVTSGLVTWGLVASDSGFMVPVFLISGVSFFAWAY